MLSATLTTGLFVLTQVVSNLVLLPQGEVRGGYRTYGLSEVSTSQLYRKSEPGFDRFLVTPDIAAVSAVLSANGRQMTFSFNSDMAVDSDLSKLKIPLDKQEVLLRDFADRLEITLSPEFLQVLNEFKESYPHGSLQADDRRCGDRRMYRVRLSDFNPELENRSLSILYRVSLKLNRPFSLYLHVDEDDGLDLTRIKDMTIASVGLGLQKVEIQETRFNLDLPPLREWSDLREGRILPFYEGLRLLDQKLLPRLMAETPFDLKNFPDAAWRRPLLERAMSVYFADPSAPGQNTCDVYEVSVKSMSSSELVSMSIYWPLLSKVEIPHRVIRTEKY